jgi:transcriptional regulator with XRE-family HTH domain
MRVRLKRDAVEAALVRRNWTKTTLARLAGLHRTHLSDLLAGRANAGPQTRQRLLEILGGDFDDYFEIIHERKAMTEEDRILGLLDHLGDQPGEEAAAGRRRLRHMLEDLRRKGWLDAADRAWLREAWAALERRQEVPGLQKPERRP